jgi:hypothetical protein
MADVLSLHRTWFGARRRIGWEAWQYQGSSYDGTWSVAIYTLRGDCGSLRAALRIAGGRVYSGDGSYQACWSRGRNPGDPHQRQPVRVGFGPPVV